MAGSDLFEFEKKHYLLVADYFFWLLEIMKLPSISSMALINATKSIFARNGVPEIFGLTMVLNTAHMNSRS